MLGPSLRMKKKMRVLPHGDEAVGTNDLCIIYSL